MKNCYLEKKYGVITFKPTHHEKLEARGGTGEDVVIQDTSSAGRREEKTAGTANIHNFKSGSVVADQSIEGVKSHHHT